MKSLIKVIIFLGIFAGANLLFGMPRKKIIDHSQLPEHRSQKEMFETALKQYRPEVILLGNSMLTESVDERYFSTLTGKRSMKFCLGGSASAWWYLCIKNVICTSEYKPKFVVLFFRDNFLTIPDYRVKDSFAPYINDMMSGDDPLLDRLAYLKSCSALQYTCMKYSSIYQQKNILYKNTINFMQDDLTGKIAGVENGEVMNALKNVFDNKNFNRNLITQRQGKVEAVGRGGIYDFDRKINSSFLPEMIRSTKENDIQLVLVRVKRRREIEGNPESELVNKYMAGLERYLREANVPLIDFSNEPSLTLEHFADGDHLNREKGMPLFTQLLAKNIKGIFATCRLSSL